MNPSRVAVFIDNSNVYKILKELKKIDKQWVCTYDPLKLAQKLTGDRNLIGVYFYCTPPPSYMLLNVEGKKNYSIQTRYYTEIQKLPNVEVKFGDLQMSDQRPKEKNLDTQLTANMILLAAQNKFDTAILVASDRDYISAIEPTKNSFGKKVEVVYFKDFVSASLWQIADVPRKARPHFFEQLKFKTDDL
jgi:uncharacterized LabA/DUF88 family protein